MSDKKDDLEVLVNKRKKRVDPLLVDIKVFDIFERVKLFECKKAPARKNIRKAQKIIDMKG